MSTKESKTESRVGVTSRYTPEELRQLDWYAKRFGCDRANAPRHLLAAYFTAAPDLRDEYQKEQTSTQAESTDEVSFKLRYLSEDPRTNLIINKRLNAWLDGDEQIDKFLARVAEEALHLSTESLLRGEAAEDCFEANFQMHLGYRLQELDPQEQERTEGMIKAHEHEVGYQSMLETLCAAAKGSANG